MPTILGGQFSADGNGRIDLSFGSYPSLDVNLNIPNKALKDEPQTPFPTLLYQQPAGINLNGSLLLQYFRSVTEGANKAGNFGKDEVFQDYPELPVGQTVTIPDWVVVGPTKPAGVRFPIVNNGVVQGSSFNDVINGNQGNSMIFGNAGIDYLRGGRGADDLSGGDDNDILNGNRDDDYVDGEAGNDFLRGGQGNDDLWGGDGDDILIGDIGTDVLTGEAGLDAFVLRADGENLAVNEFSADVIADFVSGDDIILSNGIARNQITLTAATAIPNIGAADKKDTIIRVGDKILGVVADVEDTSLVFNSFYDIGTESPLLTVLG